MDLFPRTKNIETAYVNKKCPKKCVDCECRKVITHYVVPYNFCTKLNVSFCGGESKEFFNCGKE